MVTGGVDELVYPALDIYDTAVDEKYSETQEEVVET